MVGRLHGFKSQRCRLSVQSRIRIQSRCSGINLSVFNRQTGTGVRLSRARATTIGGRLGPVLSIADADSSVRILPETGMQLAVADGEINEVAARLSTA